MSLGSEWADRMKKAMLDKVVGGRIVYLAATGTMIDMSKRIWDGVLTDGSRMKYKDDYEVWAYKPPSPKKVSGRGKTGKPIKGGYYANYSAYKADQGRANTPFELTSDLRLAWFGGATPTPRVAGPLLCTITLPKKEYKKAEGLTKQKGAFLVMTEGERAGYIRRCKELLSR
jgi:hypothetical protein